MTLVEQDRQARIDFPRGAGVRHLKSGTVGKVEGYVTNEIYGLARRNEPYITVRVGTHFSKDFPARELELTK